MVKSNSEISIETMVRVLTYVIGLAGFLSVARHISPTYALAFPIVYALSIYFEYRQIFLVPRWALTITALFVIVSTLYRVSVDDPVVAAVETLLILLVIKSLEQKRFRDYMQIYLISLFLLAGCALFTLDMEFLWYFVFLFFAVTVGVILLTFYSQDNRLKLPIMTVRRIVAKSLLIPLFTIPLTVVMFVILPRTNYPIFGFLNRGTVANTGFTDQVNLGRVSDIQADTSVILRAHMERVGDEALYWRGIVFDYFDGTTWKSLRRQTSGGGPLPRGRPVRQTIYLEPYGNKYLFALDMPQSVSVRRSMRSPDLSHSMPMAILKRIQYDSVSVLSEVLPEESIEREPYLQKPEGGITGLHGLVRELSAGRDKSQTVKVFLAHLKEGNFRYSLEDLPVSANPIEDFLFNRKFGNCEYFATALALMLRYADIPSRVVGGYRGGYYNDAGAYYLVPQKNAHVWVEAYLDGKGWVRLDPTPLAIESFVAHPKRTAFFKVRLLLDALSYYWNAFIINYDFSKQVSLFNKIKELKEPPSNLAETGKEIARYLPGILSVAVCVALLQAWRYRKKSSPEERVLGLFLKKMKRHGYAKRVSEGLEEFVSRIADEEIRERAYPFVREFEKSFYRDRRFTPDEIRRLRELIEV